MSMTLRPNNHDYREEVKSWPEGPGNKELVNFVRKLQDRLLHACSMSYKSTRIFSVFADFWSPRLSIYRPFLYVSVMFSFLSFYFSLSFSLSLLLFLSPAYLCLCVHGQDQPLAGGHTWGDTSEFALIASWHLLALLRAQNVTIWGRGVRIGGAHCIQVIIPTSVKNFRRRVGSSSNLHQLKSLLFNVQAEKIGANRCK